VNAKSAPWNLTSFRYWAINESFGGVRMRARSSTPGTSRGAISGSLPTNSGIKTDLIPRN
jgi:hypothetical protein